MHRESSTPRRDWQRIVEEQGLVFGTPARDASGKSRPYWDESVHYVFEMDENYKVQSALCATCGNDEVPQFRVPGMEGMELE